MVWLLRQALRLIQLARPDLWLSTHHLTGVSSLTLSLSRPTEKEGSLFYLKAETARALNMAGQDKYLATRLFLLYVQIVFIATLASTTTTM